MGDRGASRDQLPCAEGRGGGTGAGACEGCGRVDRYGHCDEERPSGACGGRRRAGHPGLRQASGRVALPGGELRCALARELELLGVLGDLEEQGLIAGELRFRLTEDGRVRVAELVARRGKGLAVGDVHPEFRTVVEVGGVTVTGVLPGTPWRPEGGITISGHVVALWRSQARELADALLVVVDRLDAVTDERYGAIPRVVSIGEG